MTSPKVLRTVVVLYHPDSDALDMVRMIAQQGYEPIVVTNAINTSELDVLIELNVEVLANHHNLGLAVAFNQGIERALASGADYVMLLDQDTRPPPDMAIRLLSRAARIESLGKRLGCIGPLPIDRKRPGAGTLAKAVAKGIDEPGLREVVTVISSGMVIPRTALAVVGGMWNELFIDHVDHEWCFRAQAAGFGVFAATDVFMPHNMGDDGFRVFGRYKPVHRSAVRHFYIVRNTLWLARCHFIPIRWRMVEMMKLTARIPAYLMFSASILQTVLAIARGLYAGARHPHRQTLSHTIY